MASECVGTSEEFVCVLFEEGSRAAVGDPLPRPLGGRGLTTKEATG
jgi:hypothetical protein